MKLKSGSLWIKNFVIGLIFNLLILKEFIATIEWVNWPVYWGLSLGLAIFSGITLSFLGEKIIKYIYKVFKIKGEYTVNELFNSLIPIILVVFVKYIINSFYYKNDFFYGLLNRRVEETYGITMVVAAVLTIMILYYYFNRVKRVGILKNLLLFIFIPAIIFGAKYQEHQKNLEESIKLMLEEAEAYLHYGDFENAVSLLTGISSDIKENQDKFVLNKKLGDAYTGLQKFDEAIKHYNDAIKFAPENSSEKHLLAGYINLMKKDIVASEKEFKKTLEKDPNNKDALYSLWEIYTGVYDLELANNNEALLYSKKMYELEKTSDSAYLLASTLFNGNNHRESLKYFLETIKKEEAFTEAYYMIGAIKELQGRYDEAIKYYSIAYEKDKSFTIAKEKMEECKAVVEILKSYS